MRITMIGIGLLFSCWLVAQQPLTPQTTPPDPHFNRLYHNDQIYRFMQEYAAAYPEWVKLESIGDTGGGGQTWLLTINNPNTGAADDKPAFWIDGATHANEAQGTETCLYIINFLLKNYGKLPKVTETMDRAAFYFVPIVSPDSRALWFDAPATPNYPRTLHVAYDDDRDGQADEDGYDDLNGDGEITLMRKKVPMGMGSWKQHPEDPRLLIAIEADEQGDYVMLGTEGIDNDGDGAINEDGYGYVDPNRTWGFSFQPRYVQSGASDYPLQYPATRNIAEWVANRPNIAAMQSFHNYGRMILRGPGAKSDPSFPPADVAVLDLLGEEGEKIMPGYNYYVIWKDLYPVYGGSVGHFYGIHGILSFTNELNGTEQDFDGDGNVSQEEKMKFNDQLTLGRMFVDWQTFEHPQYGTVEIGGYRHDTERAPEGWRLEEDCHRNNAFIMMHAYHLPKLAFGTPEVEKLDRNLWKVYLPIQNTRAIPSMTARAVRDKLHRPDLATVTGADVLASGIVVNPWLKRLQLQEHRPERLAVNGVPSMGTRMLYFLVEGKGEITVTYDSLKGGEHQTTVRLQ